MRKLAVALLVIIGTFSVSAQEQALFGDEQQPGNRLHQYIADLIDNGDETTQAIELAIDTSLTEESTLLDTDAKTAVALDKSLSSSFFALMVENNSLIEVTKILIEESTGIAGQIIALGTYLYPDFAQDILNGAALTGVISDDDAFAIALASGADPTTISTATAAAAAPVAPAPIGAGIGAGGTGGGDTTASTN
jgi:hypothetical protein